MDRISLKVLVLATQKTPLAARIAIALADAGFQVAAFTPHGHPVRRSRRVGNRFTYYRGLWLRLAVRTFDQWSPDFLVCTDDLAVRQLQNLYLHLMSGSDTARPDICRLIELSLGPADSFSALRDKSDFLLRAAREGLRCPPTFVIPAARDIEGVLAGSLDYPVVVKADQSYGGICVRLAHNNAAVRSCIWELQTPTSWHSTFRRLIGKMLGFGIVACLGLPLLRTVSLQYYIKGHPANRAVICWQGRVLAGISVEAVEVKSEHGPASVIRVIANDEMTAAADRMVKCLNLSGFIGFDFILDSSGQAWIIEMNPRVTPICQLSLVDGTNLSAALYAHMAGRAPLPEVTFFTPELIALFPDEVVRSPSSEYLRCCRHDVPWSEPELVCSVLSQALRIGIRRRVRAWVQCYPPILNALVKLGIIAARPRLP